MLEPRYDHQTVEEKIYKLWEKSGYFNPDRLPPISAELRRQKLGITQKKSRRKSASSPRKSAFCIIMPPPNANGSLHLGHAFEVALQDLMIRYQRMRGRKTLWLPGADHAGFETQVVFDKKLEKEGRNRFAIDRQTLWKEMWDFTQANKKIMEDQFRKLGASCDWSREKFTLDSDIVKIVYETFGKLYSDGLIYRGLRVVNWCPKHKTALSDLEVKYVERQDPLYYIKYGPLTLATVRPETKFGDTALAVNPKDKRYKEYIGKEIETEGLLGSLKFKVISDEAVDPAFGTGVIKVTPAHDMTDFEIWQRHKEEIPDPFDPSQGKPKIIIDENGRLTGETGKFKGLKVSEAREKVAQEMEKIGILEKTDPSYVHQVAVCYKCGNVLEPLPKLQWFVKMTAPLPKSNKSLRDLAVEAVKKKKIKLIPRRTEKIFFNWMKNLRDWNISRQIVWGIRIPAWYCIQSTNLSLKKMGFHESVVPQIFKGKTKTYRLRNHDLKKGDCVDFENSQSKEIFGYGTITNIFKTVVGKVDLRDKAHGATYKNTEELIAAFKRHYPNQEITKDTEVFIYSYAFKKTTAGICKPKINPDIKARLFLVRHGETDWNKEGRTQGHADIPLNDEGKRQARDAAEALKNKNIDLIISSDLGRCRATAEIIRETTGAEVIFDKNLRERHLGVTQGMLRRDRDAMYGDILYTYEGKPPGGESFKELEERVWESFKQHKKSHRHKNIVIVTHGGPIRMIFKNIKKWGFDQMLRHGTMKHAQIVELAVSDPCATCGGDLYEQDPDVFDTWFSSGQWPFATLMTTRPGKKSRRKVGTPTKASEDFKTFYPTDVMAPGHEILFFWVARMIMLGIYRTGAIPFKTVYLHGIVRDKDRQKMSKSKGNVIDPLGVAELYGTDAVRMSLIAGTAAGNDPVISEDKIRGYRNFATKMWNIARFILLNKPTQMNADQNADERRYDISENPRSNPRKSALSKEDKKNLKELQKIKSRVTKHIEKFEFHLAAETVYHYVWHTFADKIIEDYKPRLKTIPASASASEEARGAPTGLVSRPQSGAVGASGSGIGPQEPDNRGSEEALADAQAAYQTLETILLESLKMLHPFMSFITEEIFQKFRPGKLLMVEKW